MQLLIPLANFDSNKEIKEEAFFQGQTLINLATKSFNSPLIKKVIIVINKEIFRKSRIVNEIRKTFKKKAIFVIVSGNTDGATCTSLLGIDEINKNQPLIITSLDQIVNFNLKQFINHIKKEKSDAGLICFNSIDPKWSYLLVDKNQNIKMLSEKRPISNLATAGVYFFKKAEFFLDSAKSQIIKKNTDIPNIFYISGVYNELLLLKKKISIFKINEFDFHKIGSHSNFKDLIINTKKQISEKYFTELTTNYVEAFNKNNYEKVGNLFNENSTLIEVGINQYFGKEEISKMFKNLFKNRIKLEIQNITVMYEKKISILEFKIFYNKKTIIGNDMIFWKNSKIEFMKAYFYEI